MRSVFEQAALLRVRARLNGCVRGFFKDAGFVEVETPLLAERLIPEPSIRIFATEQHHADGSARELYLTPSPELWMKRLVAAGMPRVYQLARCFRNVEEQGPFHHREFTMLEWYATDEDYHDALAHMEALLAALRAEVAAASTVGNNCGPGVSGEADGGSSGPGGGGEAGAAAGARVQRVTMAQLWLDEVGCDPAHATARELAALARRLDIPATESDTWEQLFNRIFLTRVEPRIATHRPVVVLDYPARIPTLAATAGDGVHAKPLGAVPGRRRGSQLLPGRNRRRRAGGAACGRGGSAALRTRGAAPGPGAGGGVQLRRRLLGRGRGHRPAVRAVARAARDHAAHGVRRLRLSAHKGARFWYDGGGTMVKAGAVDKGMYLLVKGTPHLVTEREFVNPGKGSAFVRLKLKNIRTGLVVRQVNKSQEQVEDVEIDTVPAQYLYSDGDGYVFMNAETYDQFTVPPDGLEDRRHYLLDGETYQIVVWDETPLDIKLADQDGAGGDRRTARRARRYRHRRHQGSHHRDGSEGEGAAVHQGWRPHRGEHRNRGVCRALVVAAMTRRNTASPGCGTTCTRRSRSRSPATPFSSHFRNPCSAASTSTPARGCCSPA